MRNDGTVTAGTWKKYKVMKERKLPPIPEEHSCTVPHIGIRLFQTHGYSVICFVRLFFLAWIFFTQPADLKLFAVRWLTGNDVIAKLSSVPVG